MYLRIPQSNTDLSSSYLHLVKGAAGGYEPHNHSHTSGKMLE